MGEGGRQSRAAGLARGSGSSLEKTVIALVPSLSRSTAEQFNVFRVMHHGTHEKQISNVFAWLLRHDGTHGLGDAFQRLFVALVNTSLAADCQLPAAGYHVQQEVDTSSRDDLGKDIADIVLTCDQACIVVENFESSDGHGHGYERYHKFGTAGARQSVVVLLCDRHEPARQTNGWERAVVVTYASLLQHLGKLVAGDAKWQRAHPQQHSFLRQLIVYFVEGPGIMSNDERIAFIKAMCETGESVRYGYRPQELAAQMFADELAQRAKRQFEEGRLLLAQVKKSLKAYAAQALLAQVNGALGSAQITGAEAKYVGQWEWCVALPRANSGPALFLEFGPTAAVQNDRAQKPVAAPDFTKVFVTREAAGQDGIDLILQTEVGLGEVLSGLTAEDTRLRNAVLEAIRAD